MSKGTLLPSKLLRVYITCYVLACKAAVPLLLN